MEVRVHPDEGHRPMDGGRAVQTFGMGRTAEWSHEELREGVADALAADILR